MRYLQCILLLLLTLSASAAFAQELIPERLGLDEAVKLALQYNPDLRTAKLEVKRSHARVTEAWGSALPSLDISGSYARALKLPVFYVNFGGDPVAIEMGLPHTLSLSLTGKQILYNGAVAAGLGAARVYSDLTEEQFRSKQIETVVKTRKAYYGALLAREVVGLMHASLSNAEENLKNVLLMRKQGIVSEYDELRASVQVENLHPTVMQSENNYDLALDNLRNIIGVDKERTFEIADSLRFVPIDESLMARAENLVLESNPGLQAMNRQIDLNEAAISAERSNYLPTIAAFGQYQYQAARNDFGFSQNDLIGSAQVGLSLTINIFQGLQTQARVEQAELERSKSEEQKVSLERTLKTGVHSVVGNLRQARKRIEAQQKTVETAERGYRIATARYLSNAATQLEVNDAEVALTQARVNRIQAVYDYLVAAADLEQLIGRLPEYAAGSEE